MCRLIHFIQSILIKQSPFIPAMYESLFDLIEIVCPAVHETIARPPPVPWITVFNWNKKLAAAPFLRTQKDPPVPYTFADTST